MTTVVAKIGSSSLTDPAGVIDLGATEALGPEVVYVVDLAAQGASAITLEPADASDPDASAALAGVDGLVTLSSGAS